ncbi:MAG: MinD/ParA family protein [Lachnospiraceae bacterium]|nr:MinD/ParA family protein [Lachnospiraceae bacterium]
MDQAEKLRLLTKSIHTMHKARVITVTSGKGGVGKSNISVNLAIQLAKMGKKVIILDADFGLANVEVMLGIRPKYNLADLMFRGKELKEIITSGPENIGFISGGSGIKEMATMTREQVLFLTNKLVELDEMADFIIVDTGAGISDSVLEFVSMSQEVLLVATPEPTSITDAYALLKTLNKKTTFQASETVIKFVANRVSSQEEGKSLFEKMDIVVSKFLNLKLTYLGCIPMDPNVTKAVCMQKPFSICYPSTIATKAIVTLTETICNEDNDIRKNGISTLFSGMIRSVFKSKKK